MARERRDRARRRHSTTFQARPSARRPRESALVRRGFGEAGGPHTGPCPVGLRRLDATCRQPGPVRASGFSRRRRPRGHVGTGARRMSEGTARTTVARAIVEELYAAGVRRIYGMPGGGSNMAIVGAVKDVGIEFVLVHHEPAAMFAAAGESELSGVPGVCIATVGPGVASSMNGLAHCRLDQVPLVLITDRPDSEAFLHQKIDHSR